jgi:hypothetical protein
MTITEMLDKVQYTTDEQGNKVVLVDLETWQQFEAILREAGAGQEWFWSEEWQAAEKSAEEDLAAGRYETFDTMEEFLADL